MKFPIHLLSLAGMCNLYAQPAPTFTKDIAPILQARCQVCHRPGEAAPFSLMTYEQTRPWAKAIREAVLARNQGLRFLQSRTPRAGRR